MNWLTGYDELGGVPDGPLAVLGHAHVVANVILADAGYPQFRAVVGHHQRRRGLHQIVVAVPQDLGHRTAHGQTRQNDRVAQTDVDDVVRRIRESGRHCFNKC